MTQSSNSLMILLNLVKPGHSSDQLHALAAQLNPEQWGSIISEAEHQSVMPYLYSLMVKLNKSYGLEIPQREKLHPYYRLIAAKNMLILHTAEIVINALHQAGIPAVGIKGIYLLENVYLDIGARSMNDIDILIQKKDLDECIRILEGLGYRATGYFSLDDENIDTKHVPPMQKPGGAIVEAHWTLLEEDEPFTIDPDALWERAIPARIADVDALALSVEDLILHLCLHLTYQHYLNLGLRGLLDIALVIHKFADEIDWQKLIEIALSWRAQKVAALTLKLVETQLKIPIPAEVITALVPEGIEPGLLENARSQLLERVWFDDHFTPDLVEFSGQNTLFSKIKIGFQRVFIPRLALARIYNVPPHSPKIAWYYLVRLNYLVKSYGKTLLRLQRREKTTEPARQKAEISQYLHEWLKNPRS